MPFKITDLFNRHLLLCAFYLPQFIDATQRPVFNPPSSKTSASTLNTNTSTPPLLLKRSDQSGTFYCKRPGCFESFTQKWSLLRHEKSVHQNLFFSCNAPNCKKRYKTAYDLEQHKRTHAGLYYRCGFCHKSFTWKSNLTRHQKKHFVDPPRHTCSVSGCNKYYTTRSSLKRHMLVHQNTRFTCPVPDCDKVYVYKGSLRKHQKNAHKQLPDYAAVQLPCPFPGCKRTFQRRQHLERHKNIHKGVRFYCNRPNCPKSYNSEDNLRRHQKTHANDQ